MMIPSLWYRSAVGVIAILVLCCCCNSQRYETETFSLMGTYITVTCPEREAGAVIKSYMSELSRVFSPSGEGSDIGLLNAAAGYHPVVVRSETIELLLLSKSFYDATEGFFDITAGRVYALWKQFIRDGGSFHRPSDTVIEGIRIQDGFRHITIDASRRTVFIDTPAVQLDVAGIAKGFIVDKAIAYARQQGIASVLIEAGGDMYCLGTVQGRPWRVGIRHPADAGRIARVIEVTDRAVATSGNQYQHAQSGGTEYGHLINPRTGVPVDAPDSSVTVVAATCAQADAYATAFLCMGREKVASLMQQMMDPSLSVFWITVDRDGTAVIDQLQHDRES